MGRERGQIDLTDELEHAPAEDLIVVVLASIVNKLLRVHIHQHRVDIVAQARHLSLLELIGLTNREIHGSTKHFMHILGAAVGVRVRRPHQRSVVQELTLLSLALTPRLELLADPLILLPHFERETAFLFPGGPLWLIFVHNVDQRLSK